MRKFLYAALAALALSLGVAGVAYAGDTTTSTDRCVGTHDTFLRVVAHGLLNVAVGDRDCYCVEYRRTATTGYSPVAESCPARVWPRGLGH